MSNGSHFSRSASLYQGGFGHAGNSENREKVETGLTGFQVCLPTEGVSVQHFPTRTAVTIQVVLGVPLGFKGRLCK